MKKIINVCISEWEIPEGHDRITELAFIKFNALRCKEDHAKLCKLNPKAKDSYDAQLETTLAELNRQASALE